MTPIKLLNIFHKLILKIKLKYLFSLILIHLFNLADCQEKNPDEIYLKSTLSSYKYFKGDSNISYNKVLELLSSNQNAYDLMRISKVNGTVSSVLGISGIILINATILTIFSENEPVLQFAGIGAGFLAASAVFSRKHKKQAYNAIQFYNEKLDFSINEKKQEIRFFFCGNGVKIQLLF